MPKVSVIIPAYNAAETIQRTIESVLYQTTQDIEIIVVDDGSTDNTREIVSCFGEKVGTFLQENQGHAVARNTGLKASRGEYCAFLDADDLWVPEKTERQVQILDEHPQVGIVHCDLKKVDLEGHLMKQFLRRKKFIHGNIFSNILTRKGHIATSSAMFRKECVYRHGLFDESVREWGSEDREFWMRICKDWEVAYIDEPLVVYQYRENSLSQSRTLKNRIQGRRWAIKKSLRDVSPFFFSWVLKRISFSAVHKELAYVFLLSFDFESSREQYRQALKFWPFDFSLWIGIMRSTLKIKINTT